MAAIYRLHDGYRDMQYLASGKANNAAFFDVHQIRTPRAGLLLLNYFCACTHTGNLESMTEQNVKEDLSNARPLLAVYARTINCSTKRPSE